MTDDALDYTEVHHRVVDSNELDRFIKVHLGHDFEFIADQECDNDSEHSFNVDKGQLDDYGKKLIVEFKKTSKGTHITGFLLNHLCDQGVLAPGEYLISVSW